MAQKKIGNNFTPTNADLDILYPRPSLAMTRHQIELESSSNPPQMGKVL